MGARFAKSNKPLPGVITLVAVLAALASYSAL